MKSLSRKDKQIKNIIITSNNIPDNANVYILYSVWHQLSPMINGKKYEYKIDDIDLSEKNLDVVFQFRLDLNPIIMDKFW